MKPNKNIIWIIQANQTTPVIVDFLKTLQTRVENHISLEFWVPETSAGEMDKLKALSPTVYKTVTRTAAFSDKVFEAKKQALEGACFSQGLLISDVLLLDDLGGAIPG
ncbi:MAG: hypothetical protein HUN05_20650 [Desulfobacter sp.]|nr:MAG: hypothetical protein HUN05_20650 [Desulfobacter sp.]